MLNLSASKLLKLAFVVVALTGVGFFASVYAGVLAEQSLIKTILSFIGFSFLWPYNLYAAVEDLSQTEDVYFSFVTLGICQMVGYASLYYVCAMVRKFELRRNSSSK